MHGTRPIVMGTINGQRATFMTDSGAFFSTLSRESASKFGLRLGPLPGNLRIYGTNGAVDASLGNAKEFTLDGLQGGRVHHKVDFVVGGKTTTDVADGIIGQNILGNTDSEYDLANGVIRLYVVKDCSKRSLAYWHGTAPVAVVETEPMDGNHKIVSEAMLNGKKIRIVFDSGAATSVLTLKGAARVGIKPQSDEVVAAGLGSGMAQRRTETWVTHFDSLDLGGELIQNARLRIADINIAHGADMLLGADFFLSHRLFISASQHKVYFTYNGGPVFDLRDDNVKNKLADGKPQKMAASADTVATTTEAPADSAAEASPADIEALRRHAMACAGRRDYVGAIADFDAILKADANDAVAYYQRASAHWNNHEPALAKTDMDQALTLKPDFTKALIDRGTVRLTQKNTAGAREDFDAAIHSAPNDGNVRMAIAGAYFNSGKFGDAITNYDAWIAANPKSEQLPFGLTQRCRARAFANQEIELALDDCNRALKKVTRDSGLLDNRALVYQRLGNYDKAISDYKASLKLQPKKAWTWYGLGISQKMKGLQADSEKSIQTALALAPQVGEAFNRIGLSL